MSARETLIASNKPATNRKTNRTNPDSVITTVGVRTPPGTAQDESEQHMLFEIGLPGSGNNLNLSRIVRKSKDGARSQVFRVRQYGTIQFEDLNPA